MGNNCCLYASSEDLNAKPAKDSILDERKAKQATELPHISDREGKFASIIILMSVIMATKIDLNNSSKFISNPA